MEEEEQEEKSKFLPEFQRGQKPELLDCCCKLRDEWKEKEGRQKEFRSSESDVKEWQCDLLLSVGVSHATVGSGSPKQAIIGSRPPNNSQP